jgi:bifunctional non-homologous end joining protein LigD
MALAEYNQKRKFGSTPEPKGKQAKASDQHQLRFVVQKHKATRLHYDFRLELDGVLLSWAVPKGPSLNPADKRLAMMVEDHPMDYRLFEGTIPKGNYGAGTVMVWDEGAYSDAEDNTDPKVVRKNLKAALKKGDLKFTLHGEKLNGSFVLVKIKSSDEDNAWLLIKHKDEYASAEDVTELDRSVLSGRSMEEITNSSEQWLTKPKLNLRGVPKAKQPDRLKPMLASLANEPFDDPEWLYEIKWDGYRIVSFLRDGKVQLKTRNDQDYTAIYEHIALELANLRTDAILDGEMVVVDKNGRSNFGALQNYQRTGEGNLAYYVFDLPFADGRDLRELPLIKRKELLAELIAPLKNVRLSDHVEGRGKDFFKLAQQQQLEGIMAKKADSSYLGRRSRSWLKLKTHMRQEAVIGGWTEPKGSRQHFGSLILGVYDAEGKLQPVGSSGGGLSGRELERVYNLLKPLERKSSPFATHPTTLGKPHWVEPKHVVEVSFSEWTADGSMRHPVYEGLREDKDPRLVVREQPIEPSNANDGSAHNPAQSSRKSNTNSNPRVEVTHPDKVFFPEDGITKGDLVDYYDSIAGVILPYLKDRPESLNRHPNGIHGESFYQKNLEKHPDWVKTVALYSESNEKDINWLVANDKDHLLYMVNLGSIEIHPWHSRALTPNQPDYCLIDLDAKDSTFEQVIKVAQETHKLLEELGVPSYPKTSGKTGLHILIPLGAKYDYEQSKTFAQLITNLVHQRIPNLTSIERTPSKRKKGSVYLDYLQNRKGQTMAAPYCVRPVTGAPVSTPLKWDEVRKGLDPKKYTLKNIHRRLSKTGDLLEGLLGGGIDMAGILDKLNR